MEIDIQFGSKKIVAELLYSARKSIGVQVQPDGSVKILVPEGLSEKVILEKVKQKAAWILKQQLYFKRFMPHQLPRKFVSGETHLYLGRQHKLKVVKAGESSLKVYRGQMWVYNNDVRPAAIRKMIEAWYRERASVVFHQLFDEVFPKIKRYYGGTIPGLTIRNMSRRWGSCTRAGNIVLNLNLIKASKSCIEYVIIHELCHLVHHDHTEAFFKLLRKLLPDWERRKQRLEERMA